eukprot:g38590.t1
MVGDWKLLSFVTCRAQVLYKMVAESTFGLTDVEEATSGAADVVDQVDGRTGEPLSDMKGLFWMEASDGGEGGGVGAVLRILPPLQIDLRLNIDATDCLFEKRSLEVSSLPF